MKHDEFVQKYRNGLLVVRVNREEAGFLYERAGLIPHSLRRRQANFRAIAFGGAGLGIVLFFFVECIPLITMLTLQWTFVCDGQINVS